jgi:cytochrome c553
VIGDGRALAVALAGVGLAAVAAAAPTSDLRRGMRDHFGEVREIGRALAFGRLDAAREHAAALARTAPDARVGAGELATIRDLAREIAAARRADEAYPALGTLATACAACHVRSRARPPGDVVAEPAEDGSPGGRMARHRWAADRLWEGLILPSAGRWDAGLVVLAEVPLPVSAFTDDRAVEAEVTGWGERLRDRARTARRARLAGERAHHVGKLLAACAGCHALTAR